MSKTILSIEKDRFLINGSLIYSEISNTNPEAHGLLMNARFIQGVFDDKNRFADGKDKYERFGRKFDPEKNTDDLIAALPEWYRYGLRAFTVSFQGGGPCFTLDSNYIVNTPFSPDGKTMEQAYLNRMERLIKAADELGMAVIVSYFYGFQAGSFTDDTAVEEAVKTASEWIKSLNFTNVIIEVANEHDIEFFNNHPIIHTADGMVHLMEIARKASGGIPVGCSGTGGYFNEKVAHASDVVLIHGNGLTRNQLYNLIRKAKAAEPEKPIVMNEDSAAVSQLGVTYQEKISWGYYNNLTKQEPPTDWRVTQGEDKFFAYRMAMGIGISVPPLDAEYVLVGLKKEQEYEGKRWIRLASLFPEKIDRVDFYRNGKLFASAYDDPFMVNFDCNWNQKPVLGIKSGEQWVAKVFLTDGTMTELSETAE